MTFLEFAIIMIKIFGLFILGTTLVALVGLWGGFIINLFDKLAKRGS